MSASKDQPNILVIWGDDIGISNLSCYSDGLMGYRTPNIDRIADEGARFTDYYGEQSCTAGRAAFICGQNPIRTGLTKVGMPGADVGIRAEDPTIATALRAHGYATGQFGKNHLSIGSPALWRRRSGKNFPCSSISKTSAIQGSLNGNRSSPAPYRSLYSKTSTLRWRALW
jgi:arylsulfatase A-like enzyme